jgi:hypothetical protein
MTAWGNSWTKPATALALTTALAACGGGGGGGSSSGDGSGSVSGLSMPNQLSVTAAQSESTTSGVISGAMVDNPDNPGFPSDSAYQTDEANTYVYDRSMGPLQLVNEILCSIEQTAADQMVNQGAYVALVNADKCRQGENQSGASQGGTQGSSSSKQEATNYERWTVISSRADNSSPQKVQIWIPAEDGSEGGETGAIIGEGTIRESPSGDKQFGDFTLNFKGEDPSTGTTTMKGTLETVDDPQDRPRFQLINLGGQALAGNGGAPFKFDQRAAVRFDDASGDSGRAVTKSVEGFDEDDDGSISASEERTSEYAVAYNTDYFLREETTTSDKVCTDRTSYDTQVWRYNLYHNADRTFGGEQVAAGDRVKLNTGLPFVYEDASGNKTFGHVGYWGVWLDSASLTVADLDGKQITEDSFGDQGGTSTYTVNVGPGKLHKRTKQTSSLDKLEGMDFYWYGDPDGSGSTYQQGDYLLEVLNKNSNGYKVYATGSVTWRESGPATSDITDVDVTPSTSNDQPLFFWADALGGEVRIGYNNGVNVVFYAEETLDAGDLGSSGPIVSGTQLKCYTRCPRGGISSSPQTKSDLFYSGSLTNNSTTNSWTYTVDVQNGTIRLLDDQNGQAVVDVPAGINWDNVDSWYQDGIWSDQMVPNSVSINDVWAVSDQDVSYSWETGTQSWNRQVVVTDSGGSALSFDRPLRLAYTYESGDDPNGDTFADDSTKVGKEFQLEYGGPGELWGFPWQPEPGCETANEQCRWYASVTLQKGVKLTDGQGRDYLVRPVEMEQTMQEEGKVDPCNNAGLSLSSTTLRLPTSVSAEVANTLADKPEVTDGPAVIEGEVQ